jgi:hypothetical protein
VIPSGRVSSGNSATLYRGSTSSAIGGAPFVRACAQHLIAPSRLIYHACLQISWWCSGAIRPPCKVRGYRPNYGFPGSG